MPRGLDAPAARSMTGPIGTPDWVVDCNGGGDFATIGEAILAAQPKQWISVEPCTYHEALNYRGKALWISSTGGAAVTTIDADHQDTVIKALNGEGDNTALVGFTLTDGDPYAVDVGFSALRLQDVVMTGNDGAYTVRAEAADLEMDTVVIDATNQGWSQAVYMDKGAISMTRSTIDCGTGSGLQLDHGSFSIDWSVISCTAGFGRTVFENEHSVGRITRSVLHGDQEHVAEDDHFDDTIRFINSRMHGDINVEFGTLQFRNSILADGTLTLVETADTVSLDSSLFMSAACAVSAITPVTIENSNFWNTTSRCDNEPDVVGMDGNISANPDFDPVAADLTLLAGSAMIDAGNPGNAFNDVDGSRNDIGVHGSRYSVGGGY